MRIKILNNSILFFSGVLMLTSCAEVNPPSETLNQYIEREEIERELSEFYFYPTTVRMLDKFITAGKGGVLDGVQEGRLFYAKYDTMDVLQRDLPDLRKRLKDERFELLAEFRMGATKTVAFVREDEVNRYVVLLGGPEVTSMLIEMKGEISMSTLRGLNDLNSENVMSLLDLTGNKQSRENNEILEDHPSDTTEPTLIDSLRTEV
ncbi:MAG: hypothetical protein MK086_05695 [Flavobacteriales bacterium]|nr:hypothetical protein [Flavobacteriales bacterium]